MDLIERLRLLEQDHEPDGWPAVRMRDITALLDALEAALAESDRWRDRYRAAIDQARGKVANVDILPRLQAGEDVNGGALTKDEDG